MRPILAAALSILLPTLAEAQSPCSGADINPTEKTICSDPILRDLDAELAALYTRRDDPSLEAEQTRWLREGRDVCGRDILCIERAYTDRLTALRNRPSRDSGVPDRPSREFEPREMEPREFEPREFEPGNVEPRGLEPGALPSVEPEPQDPPALRFDPRMRPWCGASRLNPAERTICSDDTLADLDAALGAVYGDDRARTTDAEQNAWLREVRDGCGADADCLAAAYIRRIIALGGRLRRP